jgi:hypothetical protein
MDEDWSDLDASGELTLAGLDRQGHSGWIWKLCKHDQNRCSAERGARHIVCMMERALAQSTAWDQKIIGMCDCSDVTPANLDLAMLRIAIPLMQEQYPEVQSQTLLFPSGWLTTSLYAIISPMMTSGTKKKFKFGEWAACSRASKLFPPALLCSALLSPSPSLPFRYRFSWLLVNTAGMRHY